MELERIKMNTKKNLEKKFFENALKSFEQIDREIYANETELKMQYNILEKKIQQVLKQYSDEAEAYEDPAYLEIASQLNLINNVLRINKQLNNLLSIIFYNQDL